MVEYACNINTREAEAGGSQIQGHLGHTERLSLKKPHETLHYDHCLSAEHW
jgi:hypothetical protein